MVVFMEQIPESRREKLERLSVRLQKTAFFVMSFMVVLSFMMANLLALFWQSSDWLVGAVLPGVVATLTNAEREKNNVAPLSRSAVLDAAATMKAEHMAAEEYFSHDSPGGITPWYWFEQAGYVYAHAGENLAVHFQDSDEVVKAWMNSPTHKANLVGAQYTEIGIGTARGSYKGYPTVFVVQLFGTPAQRPAVSYVEVEEETVPITPKAAVVDESMLAVVESEPLAIAQTDEVVLGSYQQESAMTKNEEESVSEASVAQTEMAVVRENTAVERNSVTPSFVATSSGLLPYLEGGEFIAGTTAPTISTLATQPRSVLQGVYMIIGSIVIVLLITSIILGYRTHHVRTVLTGVGLLILMSLLFIWHIAITGGAVVA